MNDTKSKSVLQLIAEGGILFCLLALAYIGRETPYMVSTLVFIGIAVMWIYVCVTHK